MEKAAGDERILFRLIDDEDIPDDGLGFHAQQAVEKMIKAVLAHNDVSYERTHNIAYLLTLLDGASIQSQTMQVTFLISARGQQSFAMRVSPKLRPIERKCARQSSRPRYGRKLSWPASTMVQPAPIAQLDRATPS
jgi:hypothetical protein